MTSFLNYVTATLRALFALRGSFSIKYKKICLVLEFTFNPIKNGVYILVEIILFNKKKKISLWTHLLWMNVVLDSSDKR